MVEFWVSVCCYLISAIFIQSFIDKVLNHKSFQTKIEAYKVLPIHLIKPASFLFTSIDLYIGIVFFVKQINIFNLFLLISVLITYTLAVVINLYRGNTLISCGCGGVFENDKLTSLIVYRNTALIAIASFLIFTGSEPNTGLIKGFTHPLLFSISVLMLYGLLKEFTEQNQLIRRLKSKLTYFEE